MSHTTPRLQKKKVNSNQRGLPCSSFILSGFEFFIRSFIFTGSHRLLQSKDVPVDSRLTINLAPTQK